MIIGVPRESYPGERRVGLVPMVIPNLAKAGFEVVVEKGAGVEAGYPDAAYNFWIGAFAPARTPPAISARLHDEIVKALAVPEVKKEIINLAADPMPMSMSDFDAFVRKEIKLNAGIVKAAGIQPE